MPKPIGHFRIHQADDQEPECFFFDHRITLKAADRLAQKMANETNTIFIYYRTSSNRKAGRRNKTMKVSLVPPNTKGEDNE